MFMYIVRVYVYSVFIDSLTITKLDIANSAPQHGAHIDRMCIQYTRACAFYLPVYAQF